jgi:hypothetical protein
MSEAADRDGNRCVGCGKPAGHPLPLAEHHRILGDRTDNRLSNKITLCGTGNVPPGCHGMAHSQRKHFGGLRGYIISRHGKPGSTLEQPVYYDQPMLGRVGWYLLDDEGGMTPWEGERWRGEEADGDVSD